MDEAHHSEMNILQFYLEICASELRKTSITEDKFKSSLTAVSSACLGSSAEDTPKTINFGAPQNRAAYIYKFHPCLTWTLENYVRRALSESPEVRNTVRKLLDGTAVKLCCIGGEVGADFIGFLLAISDYTNKAAFKSVSVVTKSADWRSTFNNILANLKSGVLNPVHESVLGNNFVSTLEGCDFLKPLSSKILHKIKEANVFLITKFFPTTASEGNPQEKTMKDILSAINPGALVFYIDHSNGFTIMLHAVQCTRQNILFGPLREQYRFPHLQEVFKGLFGCFPQVSTRTYFMVWEKTLNSIAATCDSVSIPAYNALELNNSCSTSKASSNVTVNNSSQDSRGSLPTKEVDYKFAMTDAICSPSIPKNGLVSEHSCTNVALCNLNFSDGGESLGTGNPTSELGNDSFYVTSCENIINGSQTKVSLGAVSEQEKVPSASSASTDGSDSSGSDCENFPEISDANHATSIPQNNNCNCPTLPCSKEEGTQVSGVPSRRRKRGHKKSHSKGKAQNPDGYIDMQNSTETAPQVPHSKISSSYSYKTSNDATPDTLVKNNSHETQICQTPVDSQKTPYDASPTVQQEVISVAPVDSVRNMISKSSDGCCPIDSVPGTLPIDNVTAEQSKTLQSAGSQCSAINDGNPSQRANGKYKRQRGRHAHKNKFTQTEAEECSQKSVDSAQKCLLELTRRVDALASVVGELVSSQRQGHCSCTNCCRPTTRANNDVNCGSRNASPTLVLPIHNLTESQVSQMLSMLLSQALHSKNHSQ